MFELVGSGIGIAKVDWGNVLVIEHSTQVGRLVLSNATLLAAMLILSRTYRSVVSSFLSSQLVANSNHSDVRNCAWKTMG